MWNEKTMHCVLAFHIFNGLLKNRLVFLKKKCQELLSMALKGKDARNRTLEKLLRILWAGDVKGAVSYLEGLPSPIIKNPKWLEEQINYLKRKEYSIACYAVRAGLGLSNSSNPVEKANDILVAQRQKHNGMSWSEDGSSALAAIEMVYQNGYEDTWFNRTGGIFCPYRKQDSPDSPVSH